MKIKITYLYSLIIFLGAFLVFQVQPIISKYILPWFGGTPAVWTVCMLFFQVCLFGGYLYAHLVTSKGKPIVASIVHVSLLIASAILVLSRTILPVTMKPGSNADPVFEILFILVVTIGLPYFTLAATSPLLQYWYGSLKTGKEPYIFYSVSNIGSLLALISYPIVLEPLFPLKTQSWIWSICFAFFALGCGAVAWLYVLRKKTGSDVREKAAGTDPTHASTVIAGTGDQDAHPVKNDRVKQPLLHAGLFENISWIVLPMLSSMLLLAITNQLCTDVASGPFLWVLPLSIYLLTFVLTFTGWRLVYHRTVFFCILVAGLAAASFVLQEPGSLSFLVQILIYSAVLYFGCTAVHAELYRLRPGQVLLTKYYLFVSAGGAIGGILVGIVAPLVLQDFYELHFTAIAILVSIVVSAARDKGFVPKSRRGAGKRSVAIAFSILLVAGVAVAFVYEIMHQTENTLEFRRNFFGVVRVKEYFPGDPEIHNFRLIHGTTYHGIQFSDASRREWPTAYYSRTSGVGIALTEYPRTSRLRIGAVGLGIGTIASYAEAGDEYRFYEINPAVIALARDGRYFHYIEDAEKRGAAIDIVPGDARLSMEREASAGIVHPYDIIVLDAFSSDAIPMHLLTKEAFACYMSLLKENGVIAVHVTNRNLDLVPVVAAISDLYKMKAMYRVNNSDPGHGISYSHWILLTNNLYFVEKYYTSYMPSKKILWTDEFSNLFGIMQKQF